MNLRKKIIIFAKKKKTRILFHRIKWEGESHIVMKKPHAFNITTKNLLTLNQQCWWYVTHAHAKPINKCCQASELANFNSSNDWWLCSMECIIFASVLLLHKAEIVWYLSVPRQPIILRLVWWRFVPVGDVVLKRLRTIYERAHSIVPLSNTEIIKIVLLAAGRNQKRSNVSIVYNILPVYGFFVHAIWAPSIGINDSMWFRFFHRN